MDPQLLFQRLIIASQSLDNMSAIFKYELCSYPPSLFDSSLMLLKQQSQHWQILSGLTFLQMQLDQKVKYNMSWMVAHSFIGFLGLENSQNIARSVTCIVSV